MTLVNIEPDLQQKLSILGGEAADEVADVPAMSSIHLCEPIEINHAPRERLLRVHGIGPKAAERILAARRAARLRELSDLRKLGVQTAWAAPYVLLDGRAPARQLALF